MKHLLTIIAVGLMSHLSLGQGVKVTLTGTIADESNNAVPFGNAVLYNAADSTLVTGSVSDENGRFEIAVEPGNYYLKVTFLSYQEKTIALPGLKTDKNLGTVPLSQKSELLEEVVVQGEKSQMELQLDKRVFNVGKDLSNVGANASEILDNVPSVTVDIDGNVSLRGSQNVRILIDGKQSGLTGISSTDALRQLQGNLVESIEVITNPSSRYDAEGEVGIINIVLKKNRRQGLNGAFTVNAGYPANYGGSFNLNLRREKLNFFANYGVNYRSGPGKGRSYQEFRDSDEQLAYEQVNERTRNEFGHNIQLGMDFFFNPLNTLTVSGLYRPSNGLNLADYVYRDFDANRDLTGTTIRNEEEEETEDNREISVTYRKEYEQKGRSLTVDAKYIHSGERELADYWQGDLQGNAGLIQRADNDETERNLIFQADYVHPFGPKGKFEAGLKSTNRTLNTSYLVEQLNESGEWNPLTNFDNELAYTENVHAAYVMAGNQFGKVSVQGGLRGELSDITTELIKTQEINPRTYFNIFPSTHLSYEFSRDKALQLSYSYRISRPRYRELVPFGNFADARSLFSGNPNLNPEFTHSIETGYLLNWDNGSLLSSAYYRYRKGVVQRITVIDSTGFTRIFPVNLAREDAYGLEFNFSYNLQNWWRINSSYNFYRAITDGEYDSQTFYSDTYSWNTRTTSRMTFFKKYDFQASLNYRAPRITPQGRALAMYNVDLGLSTDVFKGNGTVTFSVRDLFNSRKRRFIIDEPDYYSNTEFQWRARQFMLSFNYRLNQRKSSRDRGERGGDFDGGDFDEF